MNMERLMEVKWENMASRRQLYGRKVELHPGDWRQVKQISVKILEFSGEAKGGFLKDTFHSTSLSPVHAQNESRALLGHEDLFLSPATGASASCDV